MANADYNYSIQKKLDKVLILIEDRNLGNISVTNDIENVVSEIIKFNGLSPEKCLIVYKDSTERWDGWDCLNNEFILLDCTSWKDAVENMLNPVNINP